MHAILKLRRSKAAQRVGHQDYTLLLFVTNKCAKHKSAPASVAEERYLKNNAARMQQCFLSFHHQENETMFVIFVMFFKFH